VPTERLDTLLALKVLSYVPGLATNARAVGALLLDRFNRKTGRCDPGIDGMATDLGICSRTVIRSIDQLVRANLFRRHRHGGYSNRNSYEPNWQRFEELEAAWRARLRRRRLGTNEARKVSPSTGQDCHRGDDTVVTQTYSIKNLPNETYCSGQPSRKNGEPQSIVARLRPERRILTTGSADAAKAEAERRWSTALLEHYATLPVTYADIVARIDPALQEAATDAELQQHGAGLRFIERALEVWTGRPAVPMNPVSAAVVPSSSEKQGGDE
jgi:hypothetical protein